MKKLPEFLILTFFAAFMATINSCKEEPEIPIIATADVSEITANSAVAGGTVTSSGGADVLARGVCWSTSPNPTVSSDKTSNSNGIGSFTSSITGLTANTKYYVRAYATNSAGTSYGNEVTFTTNDIIKATTVPTLTTTEVTLITSTSAVSGGSITDDGGGDIIERGVIWSKIPDPYIYSDDVTNIQGGNGTGAFVSYLSGLNPETTYYVKAYATNDMGIAFGSTISFTTSAISPIVFNPGLTYGSVSDIDGNVYKTIQIGSQVWMAENLKTTKFNNGTPIPNVINNNEWRNLTTPGYSWYNNDALTFKTTYGALYNWYTVTDNRKLCPDGWHIPTNTDWTALQTYLGGGSYTSGKLKETGTAHWPSPNVIGTNETGFTSLPGGKRFVDVYSDPDVSFIEVGSSGFWWSASDFGYGEALDWSMTGGNFDFWPGTTFKSDGLSVRCLKD